MQTEARTGTRKAIGLLLPAGHERLGATFDHVFWSALDLLQEE